MAASKRAVKREAHLTIVGKSSTSTKRSRSARSLRNRARKNTAIKRGLDRRPLTGLGRPMSKLEDQAKELGIYDDGFHCMSRLERKHLVSKALSQRNAA